MRSEPEEREKAALAAALQCLFSSPPQLAEGMLSFFRQGVSTMETRVAILAIIVKNPDAVSRLNELLHQYGQYIIGRMGVPYRAKGVNIISVALDAPGDVISALSGKIGRLPGVTAKTVYAPEDALGKSEQ